MNEDLRWLAENVHEWKDGCCAIQKDDYELYVFLYGSDPEQYVGVGDVCFTRAQWQAARDELGLSHSVDATEKVWRGPEDGLPPVGMTVTYSYKNGGMCSGECEIIAYHGNMVWFKPSCARHRVMRVSDVSFRPIRSQEDKAGDAMAALLGFPECHATKQICRRLYRAGYRKQEAE